MLIKNIYVYNKHHQRQLKHVCVMEDRFDIFEMDTDLSFLENKITIVDAKNKWTFFPGLLDAHVHGYGGHDFADIHEDPKKLSIILKSLGETGLSYVMATFVSLDLDILKKNLRVINQYVKEQEKNPTRGACKIVGVHLEGPFISKACRGAHAENILQKEIELRTVKKFFEAAPEIKNWKMTIAPDLLGAEKFIRESKNLENENIFIKIFLGHTNPDKKEMITKAIQAGAVGFTHLGNACGEKCGREERQLEKNDSKSHVVQWVLENPHQCPAGVELILDGEHLKKPFVDLIRKTIGDEKILLVTDALGPSGEADGLYQLGSVKIRKEKNIFYLAEENGEFKLDERRLKILAGSAAPLSFCIKKFVEWMDAKQNFEEKMQAIYAAAIINPRESSLSLEALQRLPDEKNFAIFDEAGGLCLSMCNGVVR